MQRSQRQTIAGVITVIQLLLMAGIYVIHYFGQVRMGMMRHLVYNNARLEEYVFTSQVMWILVIVLILFLLLNLYFLVSGKKFRRARVVWTCLLLAGGIAYILLLNTTLTRAYYYGLFVIALILLLEFIAGFTIRKRAA